MQISPEGLSIIRSLSEQDRQLGSFIGDQLGLGFSVFRFLEDLIIAGLVKRVADPPTAKYEYYVLTEKGKKLASRG
jgi:DNA-binding MarR family transcriptional regulator